MFYTDDWETFAKVLPPAASPSLDAEILVLLQKFSAASFLFLVASSESLIPPQCKQLIYRFLSNRVFVGGVIIRNQTKIKIFGCLAVDLLEKRQPIFVTMLPFRVADDFALQVA